MNENYDKIEEELKKKFEPKKEKKVSGKSVFKLQEIIKKKSEVERTQSLDVARDKENKNENE